MGNTCSGGLSKSLEETQCNIIVHDVPWERPAVPCVKILPVELWEYLLLHLKDNTKELLKCREVCHDFKHVAELILQRQPVWTSLFPYIASLPLIFIGGYGETVIRRTKGTRFASARSLQEFLTAMKGCTDNPFPFRSVLLYPDLDICIPSRRPHRQLYEKFPKLVDNFGQHVWSLEYCVQDDVKASVLSLRSLYDMDNLRSLTIYTTDWNTKSVRKGLIHLNKELNSILQNGKKSAITQYKIMPAVNTVVGNTDTLGSLEHLQIMGSNGILPLNYLFAPFGKQIKSLYFCFMDEAGSLNNFNNAGEPRLPLEIDANIGARLTYSISHLCPNVTRLKIYEVNEDLLNKIMPAIESEAEAPKLKHLEQFSIKLQRPFMRPINRLCRALDEYCATTLLKLHLEISRWPPQDDNTDGGQDNREPPLRLNPTIRLTKLQYLIISYSLFLQEPDFLFKFTQKCDVLRSICFVSVNIHAASFPDFEGFCEPLWDKLPRTVRRIAIRYWVSHDMISAKECTKKNGQTYFYHFCYTPQRTSLMARPKKTKCLQPEPIPKLQICFRPKPKKVDMKSKAK